MKEEAAFNLPKGSVRAVLILLPLSGLIILCFITKSEILLGALSSLVSTGFGYYFGNRSKTTENKQI